MAFKILSWKKIIIHLSVKKISDLFSFGCKSLAFFFKKSWGTSVKVTTIKMMVTIWDGDYNALFASFSKNISCARLGKCVNILSFAWSTKSCITDEKKRAMIWFKRMGSESIIWILLLKNLKFTVNVNKMLINKLSSLKNHLWVSNENLKILKRMNVWYYLHVSTCSMQVSIFSLRPAQNPLLKKVWEFYQRYNMVGRIWKHWKH